MKHTIKESNTEGEILYNPWKHPLFFQIGVKSIEFNDGDIIITVSQRFKINEEMKRIVINRK